MQFLNEIRAHLANYETEAAEEIHKFIDWLYGKYQPPSAPIVAPPETSYVEQVSTFTPASDHVAPASAVDSPSVAVSDPAPVSAGSVETQVEGDSADPIVPVAIVGE